MTTPVVPPAGLQRVRQGVHPVRRLLRSPAGALGLLWIVFIVVASVTAPLWIPYPVDRQDLTAVLQLPNLEHWLGTDELGRDLLSRIFAAGGPTLFQTTVAAAVAVAVSLPLALWAAAGGRRVEGATNRVTEVVMAIPAVVVVLAVIGAIGTNLVLVMAILGLLISAGIYRVFVGQAKSLQSQLYVDAATVDGVRPAAISLRHILPNMATTIFVQFVLVFAIGLMILAGLAFVGFGPLPPEPSWGGLIQSASKHVYDAPWLMVPTGLVLVLTVLSANAVADTLAAGAGTPPAQIVLGRQAKRRPVVSAALTAATGESEDGLLVVNGLTLGLDGAEALVTDVSLTVRPGSVLGIVGESGCGKTLTALSLIGLLPPGISPRAGSISWQGRDLAALSEKEFAGIRGREIALISQEPMRALDPMFTIDSQLTAALKRLQGLRSDEAKHEARALLKQVGIASAERVLSSYPHQISGGMAQRVAIALALAGKPKLLVADEPTTALDVTVQAEILSLLRKLVRTTGMSMVIVTHDLGVVADICDDVAVMYAGEVVEYGPVVGVLDDPQQPYTMALLAADPHREESATRHRLASIPGQVPPPSQWPSGCRFAARCEFARPECAAPVVLTPRSGGSGSVRCVRSEELRAQKAQWTTTGSTTEKVSA